MTDHREEFVEDGREQITRLNNALLTLEESPEDEAAMEEIFRTAHTLKGNCGAMGMDRASDLAHAIEDLLDAMRAEEVAVTGEVMDAIFAGVDELEEMIEGAGDGGTPDDPADTIERLRGFLGRSAIDRPDEDEIETLLGRSDAPAADDQGAFLVRLAIRQEPDVNNASRVLTAFEDAFDVLGTEPPRAAIRRGECGDTVDALFGTAVGEGAIASALEPVDEVAAFVIEDVTGRVPGPTAPAGDALGGADPFEEPDLSSEEAREMEVEDLLGEFDELDDIDGLLEQMGDDDLGPLEGMGEAGSFEELLDGESADAPAPSGADGGDDGPVDDAQAVFKELKEEVEPVDFEELQAEIEALEFDEFEEEEVTMDELIGDELESAPATPSSASGPPPQETSPAAEAGDGDPSPAAADLGEGTGATDGPLETGADIEAVLEGSGRETVRERIQESFTLTGLRRGPATEYGIVGRWDMRKDPLVEAVLGAAAEGSDGEPDDLASADEMDADDTATADDTAWEFESIDDAFDDAFEVVEVESATNRGDAVGADADEPDEEEDLPPAVAGERAPEDGMRAESETAEDSDDEGADGVLEDDPGSDVVSSDIDVGDDLETDLDPEGGSDAATPDIDFEDDVETGTAEGVVDVDFGADVDDEKLESGASSADLGLDEEVTFESDAVTPDIDFEDDLETEGTAESSADLGLDDDVTFESDAETTPDIDFEDDFAGGGSLKPDDLTADLDVGDDVAFEPGDAAADVADGTAVEEGDAASGEEPERVVLDQPPMPIPDDITVPEPSADRSDESEGSQSIRVDADQIDSLMTLVEGLVTSRVRLRDAVESRADHETIARELADLEDISRDLQDAVLGVRMVALESVVSRLPRVVRDLAREQDKEVEFELEGADVELDRSIIDEIGTPLIHLVRNAVDHGIEPPDEREAAGKPPAGTVTLRAERSRGQVTIEVSDDGRGIVPEEVLVSAIEQGYGDEESDVRELSDEEVLELLFEPGFTTTEDVTDVSGRGVGMDVVKETVESFDGQVSIESEPGAGTTITMQLPVTVAIDEILFLEAGSMEFGVPTQVVQDVVDAADVETVDGERVLTDGDGHCPVVDLRTSFDADGDGSEGPGMAVRIREDVREVALECDFIGIQREVVVTPYADFLGGVPGISGATVRGRGEVVNIVDVTSL